MVVIAHPLTVGGAAANPDRDQLAPRGLAVIGRARGGDRRRRPRSSVERPRPRRSDTRGVVPAYEGGTASSPTRVLLATSGSSAARNATAVAAELAKSLAAALTIVHVVPAIEYRVGRLTPTLTVSGRLRDPDTDPVLRDARQIALSVGVAAETVLMAGSPPRVIVALAERLGADLLVIGATHRRGPAQLVARTGRWIQGHARCPVLAVPNQSPREPSGRPDRDLTAEHARNILIQLRRLLLRPLQCAGRQRGYRPSTDRSA